MRSFLTHLAILVVWFVGVCSAYGQTADLRGRPILREELTVADPLLEPGWILEKDGSYVRTFRRAAPAQTPKPKAQAKPEAPPPEPYKFINGNWYKWDGQVYRFCEECAGLPGPSVTMRAPAISPKTLTMSAPGGSAKTFPIDPNDHRCDRCGHESKQGTGTWVVRRELPDGRHEHWCPKCGNRFAH